MSGACNETHRKARFFYLFFVPCYFVLNHGLDLALHWRLLAFSIVDLVPYLICFLPCRLVVVVVVVVVVSAAAVVVVVALPLLFSSYSSSCPFFFMSFFLHFFFILLRSFVLLLLLSSSFFFFLLVSPFFFLFFLLFVSSFTLLSGLGASPGMVGLVYRHHLGLVEASFLFCSSLYVH